MEWKEIKEGKPVEEGTEKKREKVAEKVIEAKPEVRTPEQAEQKPEEKAPEKKTEAPADAKPVEEKKESPADDKAEAPAKEIKSEAPAEDKPFEVEAKAPEDKTAEKKARREKRLKIYSKAFFYVLVLGAAVVILFFFIGVGIKNTYGPVGYWTITEASSGDVVMKPEDAEAMGLREIGAFKLNRGGDCEITYLGKKAQGTWKQSDSGKIVIKYGEDKKIVAQISTKTGVMKAKDNESMVYKLEK